MAESTRAVSTSASLLLIFFGTTIAFGSLYTAGTNAVDRVGGGYGEQLAHQEAVSATDVTVTAATPADGTVTVSATNDGDRTLALSETDLLVDGELFADWRANATVAGDPDTDLWLPGQTLTVELGTTGDRVVLVTDIGAGDGREVSG